MGLHDDEPDVDVDLVRRMVDRAMPHWSSLPLRELAATGTDHHLFRLGDDLVVRVPRVDWAIDQVERDARWLPVIAPYVDVALPLQVAAGDPDLGYPWRWSVCRWIAGRTPDRRDPHDRAALAEPLGRFCRALHGIPVDGGPRAGVEVSRGVPLVERDELTREAIDAVADELHAPSLRGAWEESLGAPAYDGEGVWFHGDLLWGNLIVNDDGLVGVIDWGPSGIGDPATDAAAGWALLTADERDAFRRAAAYDDATWLRGRGWALSTALVALPYYRARSRALADGARRTIAEVLADS
ncbi:MAG TPA: aminoglycoside phosphotransferase family protein [Candidatus Nanopelagicales bacterium]|nr:aminoglycoside phosphotransferase family protein [Candidatus Nanopelagicales bacterium]